MISNHEKFKNVLAGVQSFVLSVAVIVGGAWTVTTFGLLGRANRARAELQELEQRLALQAVPEIELELAQETLPEDDGFYISAIAIVRNRGDRHVRVQYSLDPPVQVTPVELAPDGSYSFGESVRVRALFPPDPRENSVGSIIWPGSADRQAFFIRVAAPGLYYVTFSIHADPPEEEAARAVGATGPLVVWTAESFFVVR